MKSRFRKMLDKKSKYVTYCGVVGFIGANHGPLTSLSELSIEGWKNFKQVFIPNYLAANSFKVLLVLLYLLPKIVSGNCDTIRLQNLIHGNLSYLFISYNHAKVIDSLHKPIKLESLFHIDTLVMEPYYDSSKKEIVDAFVTMKATYLSNISKIVICSSSWKKKIVSIFHEANIAGEVVEERLLCHIIYKRPKRGAMFQNICN